MSEYLWRHLDAAGFEHVRCDDSHPGWTTYDSMIIRADGDAVWRGGYTLVVDKAWRTLEVRIMAETAPGEMIAQHLLASGDGTWTDANERHIPSLDGCIDIAIAWTPLTISLPLRRLDLVVKEPHDIAVVAISMPDLSIRREQRRYTRIDAGRVQVTSSPSVQTHDLLVDDAGIVVEYPGQFSREWPRPD